MALASDGYDWTEAAHWELQSDMDYDVYCLSAEDSSGEEDDPEAPLYTDYSVTELIVSVAGSYWLTGYDSINKEAGVAYPNCRLVDATDCDGEVVIVGNAKNDTILAGSGKSSLWGGIDGNDTMQGGAARDMFWYGEGDGKDYIDNFTTGDGDNADVLVLYLGKLSSVTRSGMRVTINMQDGGRLSVDNDSMSDGTILYSWDGKEIHQAKIGDAMGNNKLTYSEDVTYYQGGGRKDTIVLQGGTEDKLVWLDGSKKKDFISIEAIDGSESSGADQLAGTTASESIVGGRAAASLWGGVGSASDTLRAGTGDNLLYYGYGEGNDLMQSTYRDAKIMLYNIYLSQLTETKIDGNMVYISTTAGETLTVEGKTAYFTLADGSKWKPDRQTNSWIRMQ